MIRKIKPDCIKQQHHTGEELGPNALHYQSVGFEGSYKDTRKKREIRQPWNVLMLQLICNFASISCAFGQLK